MPLPGARRQLDFDAVRSEAPQRPSFAAPPLAYSPDDPRALAAVRKVQGLVRGRMVRRAMRKAHVTRCQELSELCQLMRVTIMIV